VKDFGAQLRTKTLDPGVCAVGAPNGRSGLFGQASARPSHPALKFDAIQGRQISSARQPDTQDPPSATDRAARMNARCAISCICLVIVRFI